MTSGPAQGMEAVKTAVCFGLVICIPLWIEGSSGLLDLPWFGNAIFRKSLQLRRLFIQYHCRTLGGPRLTVGSLSMRVLHRVSRDRGEGRTDPVGFRAGSLQPSLYRLMHRTLT